MKTQNAIVIKIFVIIVANVEKIANADVTKKDKIKTVFLILFRTVFCLLLTKAFCLP